MAELYPGCLSLNFLVVYMHVFDILLLVLSYVQTFGWLDIDFICLHTLSYHVSYAFFGSIRICITMS